MPTADAYHRAAAHLRRLGAQLADGTSAVRAGTDPDRIADGPIAAQVRRSLDAVRDEVVRAHVELERLAAICDRRAEICAQHAAELLLHRRLTTTANVWWPPPDPPAYWVES